MDFASQITLGYSVNSNPISYLNTYISRSTATIKPTYLKTTFQEPVSSLGWQANQSIIISWNVQDYTGGTTGIPTGALRDQLAIDDVSVTFPTPTTGTTGTTGNYIENQVEVNQSNNLCEMKLSSCSVSFHTRCYFD